ncbi:MAG: hypothetical protein LUH56_01610 [Oscillospiraceae bacterium]|nr:hypothetical protein [Oscillospiraceae bacterium]
MEALKESKRMTKGLKGKMFGADALIIVAVMICAIILGIFSAIPFIGGLFSLVLFVLIVAVAAFCPIFLGLVKAKFYEDAVNPPVAQPAPAPVQPQPNFDPYTGQPLNPSAKPNVEPIPPTQPAPTSAPTEEAPTDEQN